jgi:peroxiredoxin
VRESQEQDLMSLQAKLNALTSAHDTATDPSGTALREAIMELIDDEEHACPLKVGDLAPHFELRSYDDMSVASDELLKTGPLVLTFYRGLWCPYCQKDLRSFVQLIDEASELDNCVLAISRPREPGYDRPRDHELGLNFPVLEDASGNLAVQYGIRWPAEDARLIERALGWDLLTFRGTEPWINPMQARFIINRDGRIAFAEIAFNYEERTDPANLVPLLLQLRHANK